MQRSPASQTGSTGKSSLLTQPNDAPSQKKQVSALQLIEVPELLVSQPIPALKSKQKIIFLIQFTVTHLEHIESSLGT